MQMLTKESLYQVAIRIIEEIEGPENKGLMLFAVRDNPNIAAKVLIPLLDPWILAMSMETGDVGSWEGADFKEKMIACIRSRFRREIAILPPSVW